MAIFVSDSTKIIIAKFGPNKLFNEDWSERQKFSNEELIELFDRVWESELRRAVTTANLCEAKSAYERLSEKQQAYFDFDQEHREFRLKELWFIAQLNRLPNSDEELTQLWPVRSSDYDPKVLYIRFDTIEERKQFRNLANFLGQRDDELGKRLILEFMANFPETITSDVESFKRQLIQRQRNLNYLEEQATTYGVTDIPLELHNKIEAEKKAVEILRNRIEKWDE